MGLWLKELKTNISCSISEEEVFRPDFYKNRLLLKELCCIWCLMFVQSLKWTEKLFDKRKQKHVELVIKCDHFQNVQLLENFAHMLPFLKKNTHSRPKKYVFFPSAFPTNLLSDTVIRHWNTLMKPSLLEEETPCSATLNPQVKNTKWISYQEVAPWYFNKSPNAWYNPTITAFW